MHTVTAVPGGAAIFFWQAMGPIAESIIVKDPSTEAAARRDRLRRAAA